MSEWKEMEFGELVEVINGYAFKSTDFTDLESENVLPVIKIKNVANGNVHLNDVLYHKYTDKLSRFIVKNGDVLIALTGNHPQAESQVVGISSRYKIDRNALLNQRVARIVSKNEHRLCTDYIYYFLKNKSTHFYLASQSSGSANQANISKSDIEQMPFLLPPPEEQKTIASILSSLDDKIDLLHRQNKTLEAMAETLIRQWFVEEAEEDWEESTFGDLVEPKKGKNITKGQVVEGDVPVVAGGLEPSTYHNEANTDYPVVTISASGANAGFVRLYHVPVWSSDSSYIDRTRTPYVYFCYAFLKANQKVLFDKQEGSAQPHIYPRHIMELDWHCCMNTCQRLSFL